MPSQARSSASSGNRSRNHSNSNSNSNNGEAFGDKMKRMTGNCLQSTGLCCFKISETTQITLLENKIAARQKKFGVDYLTMVDREASETALKRCVQQALDDINAIKDEIYERYDKIDDKTSDVQKKIKVAPGQPKQKLSSTSTSSSASAPSHKKMGPTNRNGTTVKMPPSKKTSSSSALAASAASAPATNKMRPSGNNMKKTSGRSSPPRTPPRKTSTVSSGNFRNSSHKSPGNFRNNSHKSATPSPKTNGRAKISPATRNGHSSSKFTKNNKSVDATGGVRKRNADDGAVVPDDYKNADPSKWKCLEYKFAGAAKSTSKGKEVTMQGSQLSIADGLKKFKANPGKYTAMAYQSDMKGWPEQNQQYLMLHRKGTVNWQPQGISPSGWMTVHVNVYQRLIPFKDDVLPKKFRDKYTDNMTYQGRKIHSASTKPIMPGRGMGIGDLPNLKIFGDVDPNDIRQGSVGDCWLLSAISAVAEFDGAIKRLFRKTPNLDQMPWDGKSGSKAATGNMYTVSLWDLKTWKEVDIVIDERLPVHYNGSGDVLAAKPSDDGELWACYLEKALAIHCGGWDNIVGGQCTHAWAILTGCKEQYTIRRNPETGKWRCFAKYNPKTQVWAEHENNPKSKSKTLWRVAWPAVGGGGSRDVELTDDELLLRMVAWDQNNFIVGAATSGTSDTNTTGGLVDNHAYAVIESRNNVAGTGIDLVKVRNPWGNGEIEDGEFDDDGPGWDKYPQIKKLLNPVAADDGMFWVTKKEFFTFFEKIYLSASNMTEFLED